MACYNCIAGDLIQINKEGELEEYRCNLCGFTIKYECDHCDKGLDPGEGTPAEGRDGLPVMLCRDCAPSHEESEDMETDWDVNINE